MKLKESILALVAVAILGALAYVWLAAPAGQRAPDITMTSTDNRTIRLAELRGKPVLVNFWATTCTSCVQEIPHLAELYRELGPKGLEVIGVSMYYDPPNQVVEMIARREIPYPVVTDVTKEVVQAFGMKRMLTPTSYLIDPGGRIVLQKTGFLDFDSLKRQIEGMMKNGEG